MDMQVKDFDRTANTLMATMATATTTTALSF